MQYNHRGITVCKAGIWSIMFQVTPHPESMLFQVTPNAESMWFQIALYAESM